MHVPGKYNMDFRGNPETGRPEENPKAGLPGGTARPPDGIQMLPGCSTGVREKEAKYKGDKDIGPNYCSTNEGSLGNNP